MGYRLKRLPHRRCLRLGISLVCAMVAMMPSVAQSAGASVNVSATIIAPIILVKTADLAFGNFTPTATAGTVTLSPDGTRTGSNVILSSTAEGNAASFNLNGNAGSSFTVSLPSSATLIGPGASIMHMNSFSTNLTGTNIFGVGGSVTTLKIGGILTVGANQAFGPYYGNFNLFVNYN